VEEEERCRNSTMNGGGRDDGEEELVAVKPSRLDSFGEIEEGDEVLL
jgi:hypothetical protein